MRRNWTSMLPVSVLLTLPIPSPARAQGAREYEGSLVALDEGNSTVVIKTATSTGHWTISPKTWVATGGHGRLDISAVRSSTSLVATVTPEGVVERLRITGFKEGWETDPNVGQVLSLNERKGTVVIRMERSIGRWTVDRSTQVWFNMEVQPLSFLLLSRKVRVTVAAHGHIERILVLEAR